MPTAERPPAPASPLQERRRRIEILRELSRRPRTYAPPARAGGKTAVIWSSAMKAVAGAWLLVSPILIGYDTAVWNVMTFGAVLVLLVFARIEAHAPARMLYAAQGVVGIWLVLSAFWLHESPAGSWSAGVAGALIIALVAWSFLASPRG